MRLTRPFTLALAMATVAVLTLAAVGPPAGADTEERLQDARSQLESAEAQLSTDRAAYESLQERLAATQAQLQQAQEAYRNLEIRLDDVRDGVTDAQSQYDQIQDQIGEMVREAYMEGATGPVGFLLDSGSQQELADRLSFLSAATQNASYLADRATELAGNLADRGSEIQQLLKDKDAVLSNLDTQKAEVQAASADAQVAVERMVTSRDALLDLVVRLRRQLAGPDLDWLQQQFQGDKSVPYGMWGEAFLAKINAPECRDNLVAMVAWQLNEGTSADWNPLATTYDMPGATSFNSFGVRNYVSLEQGLEATWKTLQRGWSAYGYGPIVQSLRHCGSAMKTAQAINASQWCRGCTYGKYVTGLIDKVAANYETYAKL